MPLCTCCPARQVVLTTFRQPLHDRCVMICVLQFTDSASDIRTLVSSLNGVLFTGGGADFVDAQGNLTPFSLSAQVVLDTVIAQNKAGVSVPLWGTLMKSCVALCSLYIAMTACPTSFPALDTR